MADHGTVEYATADRQRLSGAREELRALRPFHLRRHPPCHQILFGLAVGGVMGHWFMALAIFIIGLLGVVPGLVSGSKTPSYVAFALCFLIFAYRRACRRTDA